MNHDETLKSHLTEDTYEKKKNYVAAKEQLHVRSSAVISGGSLK